jgi:methionyl-tRNA synthetase
MEKNRYYLSTAIDYINAAPHLGHALEKIQADVWARYQRAQEKEAFLVTGTDENGLKVAQAAEKEKKPLAKFAAAKSDEFKKLAELLDLSFDKFIRTSQKENEKGAQKFWKKIKADIYQKKYQGLYCVGCESFLKEKELVDGLCPIHKTKPQLIEEKNYFFRLSKYKKELKKLIEEEEMKIIPSVYKNQALGFLEEGIEDMCISRSSERARNWGLNVPGDSSQKIWCWFDALISYLTAIGYGQDNSLFQYWWNQESQKIHFIGKDILKFHVIYWPAMLLAAGLPLPNIIYVHSYLTINNQKMSKSQGVTIKPEELVKKYSSDALRYFLLREVSLNKDGNFSATRFQERYQDDLANGLGNLTTRLLALPQLDKEETAFVNLEAEEAVEEEEKKYHQAMAGFNFNQALVAIWELIAFCDQSLDQEEPWKEKENSQEVINDLRLVLKKISQLLVPFLPETAEKIQKQLKEKKEKLILFPKI